jgi:hypothetical protein
MTVLEKIEILNNYAAKKKAARTLFETASLQLSDDLTPKMANKSARSKEFKLLFAEWNQKEAVLKADYYKKILAIENEKNQLLYGDNLESYGENLKSLKINLL